jgi:hypothetical protein
MNAEPAASEPHQAFADPFLSYVNSTTMLGIAARLSGTFWLYIAHGIDSTGPGLLGNDPDTSGVNAMRHYNSVFHQLLKHLPWEEFDALGERAPGRCSGSPVDDDQQKHKQTNLREG